MEKKLTTYTKADIEKGPADWLVECQHCKGSGQQYPGYSGIHSNCEYQCPTCSGHGVLALATGRLACGNCDGTGKKYLGYGNLTASASTRATRAAAPAPTRSDADRSRSARSFRRQKRSPVVSSLAANPSPFAAVEALHESVRRFRAINETLFAGLLRTLHESDEFLETVRRSDVSEDVDSAKTAPSTTGGGERDQPSDVGVHGGGADGDRKNEDDSDRKSEDDSDRDDPATDESYYYH